PHEGPCGVAAPYVLPAAAAAPAAAPAPAAAAALAAAGAAPAAAAAAAPAATSAAAADARLRLVVSTVLKTAAKDLPADVKAKLGQLWSRRKADILKDIRRRHRAAAAETAAAAATAAAGAAAEAEAAAAEVAAAAEQFERFCIKCVEEALQKIPDTIPRSKAAAAS
ncbi:hypothetical protein ETH_00038790, partial [Eimeria tenella]